MARKVWSERNNPGILQLAKKHIRPSQDECVFCPDPVAALNHDISETV